MTAIQIAREVLPDAEESHLGYILWNHTGFPEFWDLKGEETVEDCIRRQLKEYKDGFCPCPDCSAGAKS